jgi:ABC-type amino acid transport substrate-binding protein
MSILRLPLLVAALLATVTIADAQQAADLRVADLVRAREVRIALFPPQFTRDPATGELKGVWADVARAFAARLGVELVLVERPTPPKMVMAPRSGSCCSPDPGHSLQSEDDDDC